MTAARRNGYRPSSEKDGEGEWWNSAWNKLCIPPPPKALGKCLVKIWSSLLLLSCKTNRSFFCGKRNLHFIDSLSNHSFSWNPGFIGDPLHGVGPGWASRGRENVGRGPKREGAVVARIPMAQPGMLFLNVEKIFIGKLVKFRLCDEWLKTGHNFLTYFEMFWLF